MLWTVVKKEFYEKILTFRFVTALILSLGLTLISAFVLSNDYALELADYQARVKLHAEVGGHEMKTIDRRPQVLQTLFRGVAKQSTASVRLTSDMNPEATEASDDNPYAVLFPTVDLTFIIGIVMSLLALLFAYDTVSGEREAGTLALIASNPVSKPGLIFGKWLGGYLALIVPCVAGLIPGLILLAAHPQIQLDAADWSAFGLILLGMLLYLGCFFALGVLISTLTTRSSTAILALLFLWAGSVFVLPNLSPDLARAFYRVPSFAAHARKVKLAEIDQVYQRRDEHNEAAREVIDKRLQPNEGGGMYGAIERRYIAGKKEATARLDGEYRRQVQRQEKIAVGIASLSPYACFTFFASRLAGTGLNSEDHFVAAVKRFEEAYFSEENGSDEEKSEFFYGERRVTDRLKSSLPHLSLLAVFTVLFLVGGYARFLRYDVR